MVILEALASGLPVAAYPVMGPLDVLGGTQAGILSEDLRLAALAALQLDPKACVALARNYDWPAAIRQFHDAMSDTLIAREGAAPYPRSTTMPFQLGL